MLPLWYGGSMSYYVYDGSGLSVVCLSVLSFCLYACKMTTYMHGGRRTALTNTQQTIQIHHTHNKTCFHACKLTTYKHGGRRTSLTNTQQTIQIHHTHNKTCLHACKMTTYMHGGRRTALTNTQQTIQIHHTTRATYVVTLVCTRNSLRMVICDNRNM